MFLVDVENQNFRDNAYVNWDGFEDEESGIAAYEVAWGSTPETQDLLWWTNVGNETRWQLISKGLNEKVLLQLLLLMICEGGSCNDENTTMTTT